MDKKKELVCVLERILKTQYRLAHHVLTAELVDNGKLTNLELQNIIQGKTKLEDVVPEVLVWIYTTLYNSLGVNDGMYKPEYFFSKEMLKSADNFVLDRVKVSFPLVFTNVVKLSYKEEYGFYLSAKELVDLSHARILKLSPSMQRESITIVTPQGNLVRRINFNENRVRQIAKSYQKGEGFSSQLKIHLLTNEKTDYEYNEALMKLTINNGDIYLLGGNHRVKALERALFESGEINQKFNVLFTVGNIPMAREVIKQEENREPIRKTHLKSFDNTVGNQIVFMLKNNAELSDLKFITVYEDFKRHGGFIVEAWLASAINYSYKIRGDMSPKEKRVLAEWLTTFFIEIIDIYYDEIVNFHRRELNSLAIANPHTFCGLVWLSSKLDREGDWETQLKNLLDKLPLKNNNVFIDTKATWKKAIQYFEEVVGNEV